VAEDLRLRELRRAFHQGDTMYALHYACEDFVKAADHPPAVSCIAMNNIHDGSVTVFSLNDVPPDIKDNEREIDLLNRFYGCLRSHPEAHLIHWNMNSAVYGFEPLAKRYRYLTGKFPPYEPSRGKLFDLDDLIATLYGTMYVRHPKLRNIAALNDVSLRDFLPGAEEAAKMATGDISPITSSTERKTRTISLLFRRLIKGQLQTQNSVGSVRFAGDQLDAVATVLALGDRFLYVGRALKQRYDNRSTLELADEYDAQDLLRSLLVIFFEDVRPEVVTPNHAGGSSRIDFVLPEYRLGIELKWIRSGIKDRSLGDDLIIDRDRYKEKHDVHHLVCLVFDYGGFLRNPRGLEKDLTQAASAEGMAVTVRIYDR
jgi:REase_DpnII-MboI